jgi:hypothetical protein
MNGSILGWIMDVLCASDQEKRSNSRGKGTGIRSSSSIRKKERQLQQL